MQSLILAILSSVLISLIMRFSSEKVKNNVSMLSMNYLTCMLLGAFYSGTGNLIPQDPSLPWVLAVGAFNGALYLSGFIVFQTSVRKNGMVLSALFMKLGLLVPMVLSIFLFREKLTVRQWIGLGIILPALALLNL